jgi:transcriptional regulator with XRE-family HTH domain
MAESKPDQAALGRAVRELREERGISQVQIAESTGFTQAWISHVEHGRRNVTWNNVVRLAAGLGVACPSWLRMPNLRSWNADRLIRRIRLIQNTVRAARSQKTNWRYCSKGEKSSCSAPESERCASSWH